MTIAHSKSVRSNLNPLRQRGLNLRTCAHVLKIFVAHVPRSSLRDAETLHPCCLRGFVCRHIWELEHSLAPDINRSSAAFTVSKLKLPAGGLSDE